MTALNRLRNYLADHHGQPDDEDLRTIVADIDLDTRVVAALLDAAGESAQGDPALDAAVGLLRRRFAPRMAALDAADSPDQET